MRTILLIATGIFFYLLARPVWAGGADETIDPRQGCFAKIGYSGEEIIAHEQDYVNNRAKYLPIIGRDRYAVFKRCWEGRAICVRIATECRKDGNVVYDGFSWQWRDRK